MTHLLHSGFLSAADAAPNRPALHVDGVTFSYSRLRSFASSLAATLQQRCTEGGSALAAVFADRSLTGFAGILGALLAGRGYVPLNTAFPAAVSRRMLQHADCRAVIVDSRAEGQLDALLEGVEQSLLMILPDNEDVGGISNRWPQHTFVGARDLAPAADWTPVSAPPDAVAYLLFTSGSTGSPKGVGVSHRNVRSFVNVMSRRYSFTSDDRFSQMFDTTFDLSVFDLFVAWEHGACVYCPPRNVLLNPDHFIREHDLTVWFSVPTVGSLMKRLGALKPGRYPSLKWSLFCGEPLRTELAGAWAAAAPCSILENLYGPTELTVACTVYRWDSMRSPSESSGGYVPIGLPNTGMTARVVDDHLQEVAPGEIGELLMAGSQCTAGYWRDDESTKRAYVRLDDGGEVFYRTGDRVERPSGDAPMRYVGRLDDQIKVLGHRVELGEVESLLRQEPGVQEAVAVGWPATSAGIVGIAAFVIGSDLDVADLRARMRQRLQAYAVPQTIRIMSNFPQNASGKVDRQALLQMLNA